MGKTPMVGLDTCQGQIATGRLTMGAGAKTARKSTVKHRRFIDCWVLYPKVAPAARRKSIQLLSV
jgi:hypothetical protein